jgi:hypothetical protein
VIVPDDDAGAMLDVSAKVTELLDDNCVKIVITASSEGQTVLGKAQAIVRLA